MQSFKVKVENQKRAKKKGHHLQIILVFASVITLVGLSYYFLKVGRVSLPVANSEEQVPEYVTKTSYFVAQTNFKSLRESVNLNELKSEKIYFSKNIETSELDELKILLDISDIQLVQPGLESYVVLDDPDAVVVVYPEESDFRLRSLDINGVSFWSKIADKAEYHLMVKTSVIKDSEMNSADYTNFAKSNQTTLFVGGEIIASRAVDRLWINKTNNSDFLFDRVKSYIESADISLAMLENSYLGDPTPCQGCTVFVSDERVLNTYKNVGFDVLSLATNHEGDAGPKAALNTRIILDELGIKHFGSGNNLIDARKPALVEAGGVKFAFVGGDDVGYFYWAGENEEGTNFFSSRTSNGTLVVNKQKIAEDIEAAKAQADIVVVMMTWGIEYQNKATKHQQEMATAFVEAGADLIVSSHPHWVQNMEVMTSPEGESIPVLYSLGNFIFDQTHTDPTRQGMLAEFTFYNKKLVDINLIPHKTCGYHQTQNNLAQKVVDGELTYEEVDAMPESKGCIWWQPKPVKEGDPVYNETMNRFFEFTTL